MFFNHFGMELGTTPHYLALHHHLVRVRPPLPALKYPVERLYLAFCGAFFIVWRDCLGMDFGTRKRLINRSQIYGR